MKRCPECRRDYYDDSLLYCLDDGSALLEGPAYSHEAPTIPLGVLGFDPEQQSTAESPNKRISRLIVLALSSTALIALVSAAGYLLSPRAPGSRIDSVAVIPLVNEISASDTDYLTDGVTESLISYLSRLPGLSVKARSSVFRYKGKDLPVRTISDELDVAAVLVGRVSRQGERLTVNLELIDGKSENLIWTNNYQSSMEDLILLQSHIGRDLAKAILPSASETELRSAGRNYTDNSSAYQLYLKGRFHWDKRNEESYKIAVDAYNQAISIDPNYALAYAGLADCYLFRASTIGRQVAMPKAKEYSLRALEIDQSLAEAHTTLAFVAANYDLDMAAGERGFKRALELKPEYAVAHQFYGTLLMATGRPDEGLKEMRLAVELEPYSAAINWSLGLGLQFARRYGEAIDQQLKTLQLQPGFALSEGNLIGLYIQTGRFDEAQALIDKPAFAGARPESIMLSQALLHARMGRTTDARKLLSEVIGKSNVAGDPYRVAAVFSELDESDLAIDWLDKGLESRAFSMFFLRVDPLFDKLHGNPRFDDLTRRMGLMSNS